MAFNEGFKGFKKDTVAFRKGQIGRRSDTSIIDRTELRIFFADQAVACDSRAWVNA